MMRDAECLFCRVVSGEVPATLVAETDTAVAFRDINPQAPTHVLVVPREHHASVHDLASSSPQLLADLISTARHVAEAEGLESGYRLVFNTGPDAGQTVFHVHLHLLGGRPMGWPPG